MKEIPFIPSMRPEPRRDGNGKYILPDPQGGAVRAWTRATTVSHALTDEYHLTQWKRRMVLQGAATRPDLLERVPELAEQLAEAATWREAKAVKAELDALCDDAARAAGGEDGSKLGTLLHTITEYADAGRYDEIADQVPEVLADDLGAYLLTMANAGISRPVEYIERITVNTAIESAGTFDRIVVMPDPCPRCGCRKRIGDLKTGKSVDFGFMEFAIQLSEYAYADAMLDDATGQLVPMPDDLCQCFGLIIHLPVGQATCHLYDVDLIAGWRAARVAHEVRELRAMSKAMGRPYFPVLARQEPGDRSLFLIRNAPHPDALAALWRDLKARGAWTDEHTQAAAARKAQLIAAD